MPPGAVYFKTHDKLQCTLKPATSGLEQGAKKLHTGNLTATIVRMTKKLDCLNHMHVVFLLVTFYFGTYSRRTIYISNSQLEAGRLFQALTACTLKP